MPYRYFESQILVEKDKYSALKTYWHNLVQLYEEWYDGNTEVFGRAPPLNHEKVTIGNKRENAILTWWKLREDKYLKKYRLKKEVFRGKTILDIGPGGIPYGLIFERAEVINVDPLLSYYQKLGFPFQYYDKRARYFKGHAEQLPLPDNSIDVILSLNVDHFDDFQTTVNEMRRVGKTGCLIRLLISYHRPSILEPLQLNDKMVFNAFTWCPNFKKIEEHHIENSEIGEYGETVCLWTNFNQEGELF